MNTFKSVVSTLSLLVAVCALLYTVWSSHQARRLDALQEVRRIAVPNLARFNGILNAIVMGGPPSSPEEEERVSNELNKLPMLYAEVREAYDTVMEAFDISVETFGLNKPTHLMQEAVLDHYEAKGHPTIRSDPRAMEGYIHTLGHGVGIDIHESPSISHTRRDDVFQIGNVLTIEPGLYYPDRGYGVRVEDLFVIDESGALVSLTSFRKDLVIPLG